MCSGRLSGAIQVLEAVSHRAEQWVGEGGQAGVHLVDLLIGVGGSWVWRELVARGDHRRGGTAPVWVDAVANGGTYGRSKAGGVVDRGAPGGAVEDVGDDLHHEVRAGSATRHKDRREPAP